MDFTPSKSNSNRAAENPQPARAAASDRPMFAMPPQGAGKKWLPMLLAVVAVVAVLGAACWGWNALTADKGIKKNQYQAVFLTNGQVYFCRLANVNDSYVTCNDIYYLQVQQSVQPADAAKKDQKEPQVSLVKLGSELHSPEDQMNINRDQVLFWENLKDDGKVAKAIHDAQKK